jgi:hypothetical protein
MNSSRAKKERKGNGARKESAVQTMPDLRAYLQKNRTSEAAAPPGSGESSAPPRIRLFSRRRAGSASSGDAEEETMGEIWWAGDDATAE